MAALTLYELNCRVRQALRQEFGGALWVTAEITEMQLNRSGHCYLQLADKQEEGGNVVATARATIWASLFRMLRPYFERATGRPLAKGMRVLLQVEVTFHELYGYSLNVKDIDPTYTLGDLERKRQEIVRRLEQEGIIDMNRRLEFPALPKTVAVISSPTAAGLGDFMNQLEHNAHGYRFHVKLFPAQMQGERTAESVIAALDRIHACGGIFDVVVVVRGGGSQTDLGSFDSYELAANIAQFPLPVITGIGHERDETIADRVAHLHLKTPTAVAAFLVERFHVQERALSERQVAFAEGVAMLLQGERERQQRLAAGVKYLAAGVLDKGGTALRLLSQRLEHGAAAYVDRQLNAFVRLRERTGSRSALGMERQRHRLEGLERGVRQRVQAVLAEQKRCLEVASTAVKYADPRQVLGRGYSITRLNGKAVKTVGELAPGDTLVTELADGRVESRVVKGITE